jgi:enamine deaminase RidA (YjgF/YER057c/UK114 family)
VVVGDSCWVSGTTDAGPDGRSRHPGDVGAQARATLEIVGRALGEAGFALTDVVRTRMFITDIARAAELIAVHGEVFGSIRPAATLVEVSALLEPTLLVEIEAEARRG